MNNLSGINISNDLTSQIPTNIILILKQMAVELAQRDNANEEAMLTKLNNNLSRLSATDIEYLISGINEIYQANNQQKIDEDSVDKSFVSFLLRLLS